MFVFLEVGGKGESGKWGGKGEEKIGN